MNFEKKAFLVIYLFLFLFAPPLIKNVNFLLILSLYSFISIIFKYHEDLKELIKINKIKKMLLLVLIYFAWYIFTILLNVIVSGEVYLYNYIINFYSIGLVYPLSLICITHIYLYSQENNLSLNDIIKCLILSGLIQSCISILSFLIPPVKTFLLNIMYQNTGDTLYIYKYTTERRFFGFANNMLDSFGFGMGILSVLPLFYSIKNGKKWLTASPLLLIVSFLNSRTGIVVFAIGFMIWLIYIIKSDIVKNYIKEIIFIVSATIVIIFFIGIFYPTTLRWVLTDFLSFFSKRKGTADLLFSSNFWKLPNFLNIIFGCGYNVAGFGAMETVLGFSSDVGYINEIWKTGIIGLLIICYLFWYLLRNTFLSIKSNYKYFIIFCSIALIVSNIKFYIFSYNPGIIIILILFFLTLTNKCKCNYEEELISVIIPVYNVEKCLPRCIESVLNQTYQKLEIILVDDGSPDNSGKICDEYAKKDSRIKVVHKKNGGLSDARNKGLDIASGLYVTFLDSDDYINDNMYTVLYKNLKMYDADMSVCMFKNVSSLKTEVFELECNEEIKCFSKNECQNNLYNELYVPTEVAWNKLYKREIWNNFRYPIGKIHEDEYVIHHLIDRCNKVVYTDLELYYYYRNMDGISKTYSLKRLDVIEAFEDRRDFYKNKQLCSLYKKACISYLKVIAINYACVKEFLNDIQIQEQLEKKFKDEYIKVKKEFKFIPLIAKIQLIIAIKFSKAYIFLTGKK